MPHIGYRWAAATGGTNVKSAVLETAGKPYVSLNGTTSGAAVITAQVSDDNVNWLDTDKATASGTAHHLYFTVGARFVRFNVSTSVTVDLIFGANG